jgi:hypothetical protein
MSTDAVPETGGAERRAWVRYPCNLDTLFQPGKARVDHRWWFAKVRDISHTGIGLILPRRFEPGTLLSIALNSKLPAFSRTMEATVVHVMPNPDGWVIGCTFATALSEEELQAYWCEFEPVVADRTSPKAST